MSRHIYAMIDDEEITNKSPFLISKDQAKAYNDNGYGIFRTVNEFNGSRKKQNITKLRSWYCEIDDYPKEEQVKIINEGPYPSSVIESKRGYHIYWNINEDESSMDHDLYKHIQERIIHFFGGDSNAKDVSRILRCPGYYHQKKKGQRYLIESVHELDVSYGVNHMMYWFNHVPNDDVKEHIPKVLRKVTGSLFDKLSNADNIELLNRLSGTSHVNLEVFEFRRASNGNQNIIVNGKGTSCFIDSLGRIGSNKGGGPTIWQWLRYYNHSHGRVCSILKEYAGELFDEHN